MKNHLYPSSILIVFHLFFAVTSWGSLEAPKPAVGKFLTNEQIVAYDDQFTTYTNFNGFIYVISNDLDYENNIDTSSLTLISSPAHGTAQIYPDGSIYYIPANGYAGTDSFTYSICDSDNGTTCDQATVSISINGMAGVNTEIIVNDDHVTTFMDQSIDIEVMFNDMDLESGIILDSLKIMTAADHGTTAINYMTGKVLYTPDLGYLGLDTFVYRACDVAIEDFDGTLITTCNEAFVTIHIIPSNGLFITEQLPNFVDVHQKGDLLIIQSEKDLQGTASIYNSNGQLILQEPLSNEILFHSESGVYFLLLETTEGIFSKKIVRL